MEPCKIIPPSVFFTQIAPQLNTRAEIGKYIDLFSEYYDFLTNFQFLFQYNLKTIENTKQFRMLATERLNVSLYIQELEEMLTARSE